MNIKNYLESIDIDFTESGSNVGKNSVNIRCPFPGCDDPSTHLGVDIEKGFFNCWACGESGTIVKLIKNLEQITWSEAKEKAGSADYTRDNDLLDFINETLKLPKDSKIVTDVTIKLQDNFLPITNQTSNKLLLRYLKQRKINLPLAIKYNLHYCKSKDYSQRLIFPIYEENTIVGFTSRDTTSISKIKHKHPKGFQIKNYLYGLNQFNNDILFITEGCVDTIRLENIAVGIFGKSLSDKQEEKLISAYMNNRFKSIAVLLDEDAFESALEIKQRLSNFGIEVKVIQLPKGKDPADLGKKRIEELEKNESFF